MVDQWLIITNHEEQIEAPRLVLPSAICGEWTVGSYYHQLILLIKKRRDVYKRYFLSFWGEGFQIQARYL